MIVAASSDTDGRGDISIWKRKGRKARLPDHRHEPEWSRFSIGALLRGVLQLTMVASTVAFIIQVICMVIALREILFTSDAHSYFIYIEISRVGIQSLHRKNERSQFSN